MSKIQIFHSDIKKILESLPPDMKVILKKDSVTCLSPDEILEQIDKKTQTGKEYYIQLAKAVYNHKANKTWEQFNNTEGQIL